MSKISEFFIDNPKLAMILSLLMLAIGIIGLKNINAETNPPVDFATATITTNYSGASAHDIETRITKPIEDQIKTVSNIKDVRSISQPGLSTIIVRVDMDVRGVDVSETMSDLQKAVDRVSEFPDDLIEKPIFVEIKSEEIPILTIAITGDNTARKRDMAADLLKEEIEDNKNVKSASLEGYNERMFYIKLDPKKMIRLNIGINEVLDKIKSRNINVPSGNLESDTNQILTRIEAKINNVEEIKNMVIRSNFNGRIVKIKDIATIEDSEEIPDLVTRYNGELATFVIVRKKSNADTVKLARQIHKKISKFNDLYKTKDPSKRQLKFNIIYDESAEVTSRLSILTENAVMGLIVILVLLFVFLPGRIGVLTSLSLPFSIMATIGCMYFYGINLNTVTILALVIVLGMLLDDSVVISESFTRYYHAGETPKQAAILSIQKLWLPIAVTSLTTIAAFLPMLVTKGIMGKFIGWIPIIVSMALILSLIECFLFLPSRLALGGKSNNKRSKAHQDWFAKYEIRFGNLIYQLIKKRYLVSVFFILIIFLSWFLLTVANKFILFPPEQTEIYIARFNVDRGSVIEHNSEVSKELSNKIKAKMGDRVSHIMSRSGKQDSDASQPRYSEGDDVGYMEIHVNKDTQYNMDHNDILKTLRSIKHDPVTELTFEAMINGPPIGSDIEVTFRSNNFEDINQIIELIKNDLSQEKGIYGLKVDDVIGEDEILININYDKADRLGLTAQDIGSAVQTAISGTAISKVILNNKEVDLFVRFKEKSRQDIADLKRIRIMDKTGNLIPLRNFVTFTNKDGSKYIKRFDYKRSKTLIGNVNNELITANQANEKLKTIFQKYTKEFPSISMRMGGVEEETEESLDSLSNAFFISFLSIFALLVFLLKSYIKPLIILTTIPLGIFGFALAFFLHGKVISFMAVIGIVGLSGVVVNSGIVLMSYIFRLLDENKFDSLHKTLSYASSMRLRSVTITSLTTIAGLAPTAYGIGGQDAVLSPMTLSMMWGLAAGTILSLIWIPCAYAILEDINTVVKNSRAYLKRS